MIIVNAAKCPKDHICPMIRLCPKRAISQKGFDAPKVDAKECIECLLCVGSCPHSVFENR